VPAVLEVEDLTVTFGSGARSVDALRGVSFTIHSGERVGIVGESGSGKSVTSQAVMRLLPSNARIGGSVRFDGKDVLSFNQSRLAQWRGSEIAMIFQDPMSSLNPLIRVGPQITEMLRRHRGMSRAAATAAARDLLHSVGIADAERRMRDYPHAFSGGMRQRVCIAIAISCAPALIIADEPTTALDVTIQAQVLDVLDALADDHGTSVILISHDLGVVSSFCDRVVIMYNGRIVEYGPTDVIVRAPRHPYTRALLDSIPRMAGELPERLPTIPGTPPTGPATLVGCPFAPRRPRAQERCRTETPVLAGDTAGTTEIAGTGFACHFPLRDFPLHVDADQRGETR
jgi:oligopeptide/dipeptide ABC transporter ATP-binding protein